jgi:hypothetical protein
MELPKLGIRDTYLFKSKWPEMNIGKAHLKEEMPSKGNFDVRRSWGS